MIEISNKGAYLLENAIVEETDYNMQFLRNISFRKTKEESRKDTLTYKILEKHNTSSNMEDLKIKFDQIISHDITYVGIIQTARASGLTKFPIPYVLTNCHNSLCAVGGTINEDDHLFGLSAAKKYGGIFVPPHQAVIHQYAREVMAGCGSMILGSDSHTRYGALGTMAVGEGGPELVKQLLGKTYDIKYPEVIAVFIEGKLKQGVGPQDVALAIIGEVFESGYAKNKVLEFVGPGIKNLSMDYRIGIDVMTTETTCLSSIWQTDEKTKEYLKIHGREDDYEELVPTFAYYDGLIRVNLSKIEPMIAMPFHPSNTYKISELNENLMDILVECEKKGRELLGENVTFSLTDKVVDGKLYVEQGIIAGCAGGGYENICDAADILKGASIGADEFNLSIYPASTPIYMELLKNGKMADLMQTGAIIKTAFCGPCFGAGDTPANNSFSIRHTTRNFPNREGSKLQNGQVSSVALMDARSIAATALNKGFLTPATEIEDLKYTRPVYSFDKTIYENRVYKTKEEPLSKTPLRFGPNIKDWPTIPSLLDNLLIKVVSEIHDPVTTTDELIPSGETSSYRSNPLALAEFALSRKDPNYVPSAKEVKAAEEARQNKEDVIKALPELKDIIEEISKTHVMTNENTVIGSTIYAKKPGDGSAREQAASCQRVLGGACNIAQEYATKRYRSNLINWGMIPFTYEKEELPFKNGDYIFIPDIKEAIKNKKESVKAYIVSKNMEEFTLQIGALTDDERQIILDGCLINYYKEVK